MSNQINDGGPAFPVPSLAVGSGMTLRDYFAAAALQGLMAGYLTRSTLDGDGALMIENSIYSVAYQSADEMLKVREVKP